MGSREGEYSIFDEDSLWLINFQPTKLITATPLEQEPVILVWDLRNSNAPEKVRQVCPVTEYTLLTPLDTTWP